jgi:single-stranded-DNA-specific exonuclease
MPSVSPNCRWTVNRTNREFLEYVSKLTGLSLPVAQALINRNLRTPDRIDAFLNPALTKLSDPYDLPGMSRAVKRIAESIRVKERILVHGDYDADGVTATAIMIEALKKLGCEAAYFIPDRSSGYGLGMEGVAYAADIGAKLIITVDCGITSFEAVSEARARGIDVVITDHHEPAMKVDDAHTLPGGNRPSALPDAAAIIDPKLEQGDSAYSVLSGAGVAFKLAQALLGNSLEAAHELIDLAALGTAADVVPVTGDNRILIKEGFSLIQAGNRIGISALKKAAGVKSGGVRASMLQFVLVPRINAAGRIDNATAVVKLLLTDSADEAERLALWLNGLNISRQAIGEAVFSQAMEMIRAGGLSESGAIVVGAEGWHPGVLGIVAAKIAEAFYRPAFVFAIRDGLAKGSARSIPPFDVHGGLHSCRQVLRTFGGHKQAAGLSLEASDIASFREMISKVVTDTVSADDLVPCLRIDAAMRLADINSGLMHDIEKLEPFGYENDEPLFGARGLEISQSRVVGNNHLKMYLRQDGRSMDSIGFDLGRMLSQLRNGDRVDAAFLPVMNEWEGGRNLQLNLKALRASENGL